MDSTLMQYAGAAEAIQNSKTRQNTYNSKIHNQKNFVKSLNFNLKPEK